MATRDHGSLFDAPVRRRRFLQASLGTAGLLAIGTNLGLAPSLAQASGGKLEIFSWWTAPGEVEALQALWDVFNQQNPGVDTVNAALAGGAGAGGNMKAVLQTRMLAGQPPDSFQVHLGHELIDSDVKAGRMEPIDFLYDSEGWASVFNQQVQQIAQSDGHQWSVPANIHRSNIIWFNNDLVAKSGMQNPASFDDWFAMAEKLKAQGIPALAIGEAAPGHAAHNFETILQAVFGPNDYKGLWTGATSWSDSRLTDAFNTFNHMLDYVNPDYLSVDGGDITDYIIAGKAASMINGDWTNGYFKSKKFTSFSYLPTPNGSGVYSTLADSFGLPIGAPDRDNAIAWLKVVGSLAGQDGFNPLKGSIPIRSDAGKTSAYDDYQRWAMNEFASDTIVPSVVHGFAAKESWVTDYDNALNVFATNRDVGAGVQALQQAAQDAGVA
jgi:glucose/mannose transport system substrate-binding protein